jgi:hypothetical protein
MSNQLAVVTFAEMKVLAEFVVKSGLFGMKTIEQALSLMALSQAEGVHPMMAIRDYHIIQGRPALKADTLLARFHQDGGLVEWQDYTETKVAGLFSHPKKCPKPVLVVWTIEQAKKITTYDQALGRRKSLVEKDNWINYPKAMLRARVISEGVKTVDPGVCVGLYTVEEVIDIEPEEPTKSPKAGIPAPEEITEATLVSAPVSSVKDEKDSCLENLKNMGTALKELTGLDTVILEPTPQLNANQLIKEEKTQQQQAQAQSIAGDLLSGKPVQKNMMKITDFDTAKPGDKWDALEGILITFNRAEAQMQNGKKVFTTYTISDLEGNQVEVIRWAEPVDGSEQGAKLLFDKVEIKSYPSGGRMAPKIKCESVTVIEKAENLS